MRIELPHPISTNKLWRHGKGARFLTSEARAWKTAAALMAKAQGARPLFGDFRAKLIVYPKSARKLDLDNAAKLCLDALKGICYEDDRYLQVLVIERGEIRKAGGLTVIIESMQSKLGIRNWP